MFDLLIILPDHPSFLSWAEDNKEKIDWLQMGQRRGRFSDGKTFRIVTIDDSEWLDRIRGVRFRSYRTEFKARLTSHQISALQAMMQIA